MYSTVYYTVTCMMNSLVYSSTLLFAWCKASIVYFETYMINLINFIVSTVLPLNLHDE